MKPGSHCPNLNHRRADSPIRFCVECGEVLNARIAARTCTREKHARARKERNKCCTDCGEALAQRTVSR
jgi:hypothetical protein